ncbi:SWIM zinc finger family protein [Aliikangiella coralliicola]|uniref:SWIM zinc finger family protein n=1 Tax=Aliikangiella coralliicola TaxID=2592383 RepID=A0A545UEX1_9GAMM|nr:SWIM zinc finger family protein [Aliikangiella coralliicola]TQV88019.1 SWIM zinc finger family protein [Aliikangiella coralliicola]
MEFDYRYLGTSTVDGSAISTEMSFTPDTLREPTFFVADLAQHIAFREGMSALHNVVVADLRFQPRNRDEYFAWLAQEEESLLAEFMSGQAEIEAKLKLVRSELSELRSQQSKILSPYYKAQNQYFKYLYKHDYNAWFVLDPVITVHPDEIFFECFSQDESSYGKLSCNFDVFKNISDFQCGTTNIDYSAELYAEFQKIRDYKKTQFKVDPTGFAVETTNEDKYIEQKIDLPDSWVRGFLQVSSAMTLPLTTFDLHPMDIHNFCFVLRRQKERVGPRSIKFQLKPGEPVKAIFEPWNHEVVCRRSIYQGTEPQEIRIWGRRRLLVLERLIPIAKKFTVSLLGSGLPSFFEADLGDMTFTLGLSGWTANDWSKVSNFDLMAPRKSVDEHTVNLVLGMLKKEWFCAANDIARQLQLDRSLVLAALSILTQAGRVIYDLKKGVYRLRELAKEPLPLEKLRFSNEREEKANNFVAANLVELNNYSESNGKVQLSGTVMDNATEYSTEMVLDSDQRLVKGSCQCHFYVSNKLYKGPCEHMLALRRFQGANNNEIK